MSSQRETHANTYDVDFPCAPVRGPQPGCDLPPPDTPARHPGPWPAGSPPGRTPGSCCHHPASVCPSSPCVATSVSSQAFRHLKPMRSEVLGPLCALLFMFPFGIFQGGIFWSLKRVPIVEAYHLVVTRGSNCSDTVAPCVLSGMSGMVQKALPCNWTPAPAL